MQIERKISFSVFRYGLFKSCRRAYYYRYIASWSGWDIASSEEAKEIYHLKNLVSRDEFLSEVLKKSFKVYLREKAMQKNAGFWKISVNEYHKRFNFYCENSKRIHTEGKNKTFYELYYKEQSSPELLNQRLFADFKKYLAIFASSSFFKEYSETPYVKFRDLNEPESYETDGILVFLSPFLMKVAEADTEIVLFHLKSFREIIDWDVSAGIAENFAKEKFRLNSVTCRSLFFNEDKLLSVWAARPKSEINELVKRQTKEIFSFENNLTEIPEPNPTDHCKFCEFRRLCL